jgi:hypothetical protein
MSRRRSSILCLWFLAAPLAGRQPAPSPLRPGGVSLELSDSAFPALAVSVPALGADLCQAASASPPKISAQTKCHPKIFTPPHLSEMEDALSLGIVETVPAGDGSATIVRLFPRALKLAGPQPFNTACGSWRYWLSLDPRATQRISKIVLRPDAGDPLAGDLHGKLRIAAILHFEDIEAARRIDVPLTLRLDLTGRWAAVPLPLAAGMLDPAASNLVLFAESSGGEWRGRKECLGLRPFVGEVCLSTPPSLLKSLHVNR